MKGFGIKEKSMVKEPTFIELAPSIKELLLKERNMEKESSILLMVRKYKPCGLPTLLKGKAKFSIKMEISLKDSLIYH